jgi:cyclic pyranopterin phosphate synthase
VARHSRRRGSRAAPIKLNAVVVRHFNDEQDMIDLARLTLENDWEVRFIEMMPFGEVSDFSRATSSPTPR